MKIISQQQGSHQSNCQVIAKLKDDKMIVLITCLVNPLTGDVIGHFDSTVLIEKQIKGIHLIYFFFRIKSTFIYIYIHYR